MKKRKVLIDRDFWEGEEVYRIMDNFKLPDEEELKAVCRYFRQAIKSVPKNMVSDWINGRCSLNYERVCDILDDIESGYGKYTPRNLPKLPPIDVIMHDLMVLNDVDFTYCSTKYLSKEILGGSSCIIKAYREKSYSYLSYAKVLKICDYLLEKLEITIDFVENEASDYLFVPDF